MASEINNEVPQQNIAVEPSKTLERKFGQGFPTPGTTDGKLWRKWIESKLAEQRGSLRDKRLHWSRHRNFRQGRQWISSRDGRTWRETNADPNDIKAVLNIIGPALDFRLGIVAEQRPGFRHEPIGSGIAGREAAEAQQAVGEYYYHLQRAWNVFQDAAYNAQTDGVAFIHVYVDYTQGPCKYDIELIPPTDERFLGLQAQGYEVNADGLLELPYKDEGQPAPPGAEARELYEGEIASRVVLAHEVIFDPEARSVNGPVDRARWAAIRRMRDVGQARLETGNSKLESETSLTTANDDMLDLPSDRSMGWQRGLPPFPTKRQSMKDGVPEYLIFITPDQFEPGLENGLWVRIIGNEIVEQSDELPGGVIPLARYTDGSADPDILPRPIMSDWISDQMSINALLSVLLKHARLFAGGRMMSIKGTTLEETYSAITGSFVEYSGVKPEPFPAVPAGQDAWHLLDWMIKKLEDKTYWNDFARGQLTGTSGASASDISGRAVLATRDLFERSFGPLIRANAEGATEWVHIIVKYAQWLFDEPRMITIADGRGDLAKQIDSESLGDRPLVFVDPETLMPLPRALRQQVLEDQLDKGRISLSTYQRRSPYAEIRNIAMGDTDQWQRAQWINTLIEEQYVTLFTMPPEQRYHPQSGMPILWQDVQQTPPQPQNAGAVGQGAAMPAMWHTVHKDALLEIILNERKPWQMRQVALERWGVYDQLERAMNDVTGATAYPLWVTGMPQDKVDQLLAMMPQAAGMMGPAGPTMPPPAPPAGGSGPAPGPASSPAPESAPMLPQANKLQATPLGGHGAVERAAVAAEQREA